MDASRLVFMCVITWGIAVMLSFVHPYFMAPSGDGFVKGMNLIGIWLGWIVCALMFAFASLVVRFTRAEDLSAPMRIAIAPAVAMALAGTALGTMVYLGG